MAQLHLKKHYSINVIFLIFSYILSTALKAQTASLTGIITNQNDSLLNGEAMLFSQQEYSLLRSFEFKKGTLKTDSIKQGRFLLRIMSPYFRDTLIPFEISYGNQTLNLNTIKLQASNQLSEVVISTQLPVFQNSRQGLKLNVENTMMAGSASSAELINKFPGLTVAAGKINAFGRGEVLIYQGGRLIPYEQFMAIPVNRIKSLEFITNPGARYDARGRSVLVVTLIKNDEEGLQGTLSENATWGRHFINASNLNLNYRRRKLSISADYGLSLGTDWNNNIYTTRFNLNSGQYVTEGFYQEDSKMRNVSNYRLGVAYDLSKKSNLSVQYDGLYNTFALDVENRSQYKNPLAQTTNINMRNNGSTKNINHSVNANYNLNTDTLGSNFFAGIQYNNFFTQLFDQIKENISPYSDKPVSALRVNDGKNYIELYTFQADYQKVLKNSNKIETGIKLSGVSNKGRVAIKTKFDSSDVWFDYSQYANSFNYSETVPAAYFIFNGKLNKFSYSAGSRFEYSSVKGYSNKLNKYIIDTLYFNFFPDIKLVYEFNAKWSASGNYVLKINRPLYQDIDPFVWYLDSLTSITGNSRLIPELNHQAEISINYSNYGFRVGYTNSKNAIRSIVRQGNTGVNSVIYIKENITQFSQWNFSLDLPYEKKYFNTYNTIALNINQLHDKRPEFNTGKIIPQFYLYSMNQIKIKNYFNFNINGELYSYSSDGITKRQPVYYLSAGVSRLFLNKKVSCQLMFNDFIKSYRFAGTRTIGSVTTIYNQHVNSHYIRIFISYKFGGLKNFNYSNKSVNESEFNRLKI